MRRRQFGALASTVVVGAAGTYGVSSLTSDDDPDGDPATDDPDAVDGTRFLHDDEQLVLETAPGQVVRGETDRSPGTELTVRLASSDAAQPFATSTTATVEDDGTFRATFDLSNLSTAASFEATVRAGDDLLATTTGVLEVTDGDADDANRFVYDGEEITLESAPGQEVRGETDRSPGTELVVRLRSSGGKQPFLKSRPTTVEDDRTFRAEFDMTKIEPGMTFRAIVLADGTRLAAAPGSVTEP